MSSLGNPAPLGLFAFGMTTAMLMFVDMGWVESEFEEMVTGYAVFLGGVAQLIVAIFELIKGSSFSFAVFGCYGTFWLGWALVVIENHRLTSEFGESGSYPSGKAAWFTQWGILTAAFFVITLRKNKALIVVFALLTTTFFLLAAAAGLENSEVKKVAGYFGFMTALGAFYTGVAELVNEEWGRHILPGLEPIISHERFSITKENILASRCSYDAKTNTLFLRFRGLQIKSIQDVDAIKEGVEQAILNAKAPGNKIHVVVDYEDTVIADTITSKYWTMAAELERSYYLSAKRFHVTSFGTHNRSGGAAPVTATMTNVTDTPRNLEHKLSC
ncbi:Succinate-acetate/proton symporter SatP [Seminavis robusta]|uniref:Succinate-acetate/proton symporter SatP n=1 Tax=Seminavis robusta TaxID=568900 RepID=A0A9N8HXE2_9STRA|nr:Succinate-acetate/proton symporter SatP [Seminavis robusta]|eukprot:Sro3059_g342940.1 Succinate-acetate/proton symporter SatP (330) ;mRNA; r:5649-6731